MLDLFPFAIHGLHADNGSEYVNRRVANLLAKLHVEFTKSRPRRSNDNALVEGKNVVRRWLGHAHIPRCFAPQVNAFVQFTLSPAVNEGNEPGAAVKLPLTTGTPSSRSVARSSGSKPEGC